MLKYKKPAAEVLEFELEGNVMNSISNGGGIVTPSNVRHDEWEEDW